MTVNYLDSANAGNYTRINFRGTGTITNSVSPAGARMAWPMDANPDPSTKMVIPVRGRFERKVTEDAPPHMRVEEYTCADSIGEKILVSIGASFNRTYSVGLSMPARSGVTCRGKGVPSNVQTIGDIDKFELEPMEEEGATVNPFSGDCGPVSHTISREVTFKTRSGARAKIVYSFRPLARN